MIRTHQLRVVQATTTVYTARCRCGFIGNARHSRADAEAEYEEHLLAKLGGDHDPRP